MKCEYCGNDYEKAKYSNGCKSCYGPVQPLPRTQYAGIDWGIGSSDGVVTCSTTMNTSYVIGAGGGGCGIGGGGAR